MANNYLTPGVYVQEISPLTDLMTEVASAVPAFIGYTGQTRYDGRDLAGVPEPVSSFKDFEARFGGAAPLDLEAVSVRTDAGTRFQGVESVRFKTRFFLYQAVYTYFQNGGGDCFIVSTGSYGSASPAKDKDVFLSALKSLEAVDDVTLLVMPEAVLLGDSLPSVQQAALTQCARRKNRFAILDVAENTQIGTSTLLHWSPTTDTAAWKNSCQQFRDRIGIVNLSYGAAYTPYIVADVKVDITHEHFRDCLFKAGGTPEDKLTLAELDSTGTNVCQYIVSAVQTAARVQPPSAAMAGIYATVDRNRGVWKAPANVSLSNVMGLTQTIHADMQESLNNDSVAGKSINALRAFPGKGFLVWGGRTLDGNSLEWRYVPVRRLFIMVEESIRRATGWTVFEPNDATLWSRLKGMIDNYLLQKWKDGALQGASPAEAFFVAVGLGSTMTEQDILEGRLIVDIGMAAVRPAEFITLRVMRTMQKA